MRPLPAHEPRPAHLPGPRRRRPRGVVEATMSATLADGNHYRNDYCFVIEIRDGVVHRGPRVHRLGPRAAGPAPTGNRPPARRPARPATPCAAGRPGDAGHSPPRPADAHPRPGRISLTCQRCRANRRRAITGAGARACLESGSSSPASACRSVEMSEIPGRWINDQEDHHHRRPRGHRTRGCPS